MFGPSTAENHKFAVVLVLARLKQPNRNWGQLIASSPGWGTKVSSPLEDFVSLPAFRFGASSTFWVWVPFRNQTESLVALLGHPLRTKAILLVGFCGFGEDVGPNFPLDGWLTFPGYGLQSFWGSLSKHTVDGGEIRFTPPFRAPRMMVPL